MYGGDRKCRLICRSLESDSKSPFIRFGPIFGEDDVQIQSAKDESWQHVLQSSRNSSNAATTEIYMYAMREVEKEARECYGPDPRLTQLSGQKFRWMMIRDGCLFLQLSFSLLGGKDDQLGLKHNNIIFLNKYKCVASMFHVGNQIPLVVLRQLLQQNYFQNVISDGIWEPPASDLAKMILFQVLILPVLERTRRIRIPRYLFLRGVARRLKLIWMHQLQNQSCDVLHGLHLLLLGPETNLLKDDDDDDDGYNIEVEEEEEEEGKNKGDQCDLVAGCSLPAGAGGVRITAQEEEDDNDDNVVHRRSAAMKPKLKSATKLKQSGIHFRLMKTEGIRGIRFKSYLFHPILSLPPLFVGSHTRLLLKYIKRYEISNSNRREVSSYLQFMSDLICTSEDVNLLASAGIIKGNRRYTGKLPAILRDLASDDRIDDHYTSLGSIKAQINSYYRTPWVMQFRQYLTLAFLLTFIKTFYAMLAYYRPPNDK